MYGLSRDYAFMYCCLRENTSAALSFLSVPPTRLWTHLLPPACFICDPPVTPSPRQGTHTYSVHTQTHKHKHNEAYCCVLWEREGEGGRCTDMLGSYFGAEAYKRRFLLLICLTPTLKVAGLTAPHSVQSVSLHSFPSGTFYFNYSCL